MFSKKFLAAAATFAVAFAQDAPPALADALSSTEDLSQLNTLIAGFPDLLGMLANATNITVLAPSNDAFATFLESPENQAAAADNGTLMALLSYHVLNGTVMSDMITSTPTFVASLLLNNETYSNVTGGQRVGARLVGGDNGTATIISGLGQRSNVTQADVAVSNGVVHIIDSVLTLPQSVSDTALLAGLTGLAGALVATDLVETVDTTPDVTIFAPTNSAFEEIGSALAALTPEQASAILGYHLVNGTVAYSSLLENGSMIESSTGQQLNISIFDGEVFVNSARVVAADVLVANGVVHLIDGVLNPNSTAAPNPDEDESAPVFAGASMGDVPYTTAVTATSTVAVQTTDAVADGYTPAPSGALESAQSSIASQASETSSAGAAKITGAIGAAALFGAGAYIAGM